MSYKLLAKLKHAEDIVQSIPLDVKWHKKIAQDRQEVFNILSGRDNRLLMIVGPCSAWPSEAVLEYANRLAHVNKKVMHAIKIIMRVYIQKPRTTTGWTGPVNQPDPFSNPNINLGIQYARELMVKIIKNGLPIADEALFTHNTRPFLQLLTWIAIGARSSEDQEHRMFASSINCAVGMKNPTHGSLSIAVNSVVSAQAPHVAALDGHEILTDGNPYAHVVLRGSNGSPNYSNKHLLELKNHLISKNVKNPSVVIDASHENCIINGCKDPSIQPDLIYSVLENVTKHPELKNFVKGFMVESFIKAGNQKLDINNPESIDLSGLSITDPCLDWERTEEMLIKISMMNK